MPHVDVLLIPLLQHGKARSLRPWVGLLAAGRRELILKNQNYLLTPVMPPLVSLIARNPNGRFGVIDGVRTRNPRLGRPMLCQLSYYHMCCPETRIVSSPQHHPYKLTVAAVFITIKRRHTRLSAMELVTGIEPATLGVQNRCSAN